MRQVNLIGTTHMDRHFTIVTKEALEGAAYGYDSKEVLPIKVEHDITLPPTGKVLRAWVEPLADGEHGLYTEQEEFDCQEVITRSDGSELIIERIARDHRAFVMRHGIVPEQFDISVDFTNFASKEHLRKVLADDDEVAFTRSDFGRRSAINDPQVIYTLTQNLIHAFIGWKLIAKIQDTVGDEIAQDAARFYRFVSDRAILMTKYAIPKNRPITYVFVAPGSPKIEFVVRTKDPEVVAQAVRDSSKLQATQQALQDFANLEPKEIQFLYVEGEWKFNFLLTNKGEAVGTKQAFGRRARLIELMHQAQGGSGS